MKHITLLVCIMTSLLFHAQSYSRVKIYTDQTGIRQLAEAGLPMDHGQVKEGVFFITDLSDADILKLNNLHMLYDIIIPDVQAYYVDHNKDISEANSKNVNCSGISSGTTVGSVVPTHFNLGSMGGYLTYQDLLNELDEMAATYPNLISVKAPISTFSTSEGRPIYMVTISDNPSVVENETSVLYTSLHHAREPMSLSQLIYYMWFLLENYSSNEEVQYLVNEMQLVFVPCVNPDGYVYNWTTNPNGGGMHRKNRRNVGTSNKGVDLNRNYSYGWGTTGISMNTNDDTYPGTGPFTEPETQAIKWLVEQRDFNTALNFHTYGKDLLYPIGTTVGEVADHASYFADLSGLMVSQNNYLAEKSSSLYPASGDSDDYMYKVDIGNGQKDTIIVMTPEIGTDFWPPQAEIVPTCKEMVFLNLVMANAAKVFVHVVETDPSTINDITGNFHHSAQRLGREAGTVTVSITPLLHIQSVGNTVVYDLNLREQTSGSISYVLDPSIVYGDTIKYILSVDNGLWIKHDTITKIFGSLTQQAFEDATSTTNWSGQWGSTASTYVSASKSFTDSPGANYSNNASKAYNYVPIVDLTNASAAAVSFYSKWSIETDYDYCQFQISVDGGSNWIAQCGKYTVPGTSANGSVQPDGKPIYEGSQSSWVLEEINLSDYLGQQVKMRFLLESDGGVGQDGFYFDDFKISYNLSAASLSESSFEVKCFPNPANDLVEVSLDRLIKDGVIVLRDCFGRIVYSEPVKPNQLNQTLQLYGISSGSYFLTIQSGNSFMYPYKIEIIK